MSSIPREIRDLFLGIPKLLHMPCVGQHNLIVLIATNIWKAAALSVRIALFLRTAPTAVGVGLRKLKVGR